MQLSPTPNSPEACPSKVSQSSYEDSCITGINSKILQFVKLLTCGPEYYNYDYQFYIKQGSSMSHFCI
ncbi:hypothetical protein HOLleu_06982 [Holothuria leucospilota]|uniref:Uncharacterized protein n=1 Tax=Holothuria leucospilota TaxID=206669 RepID=A0A9Q1HK04_HOLLE|nr:hypothetical protein HOLleu_06982 [Holothuria leucospilota]